MKLNSGTIADPGKEGRLASGVPVVPAFDGYRAYAILGIVVVHLLIFSGAVPLVGTHGAVLMQATLGQVVDVLFVVSGFVVFLPTVAHDARFGSVRAYAIRRAARLVPAYWIVLLVCLALLSTVSFTPPIPFPSFASMAAHATFLQTTAPPLFHWFTLGFGLDAPVWTLSVEVSFYVVLPFVAAWYARRPLLGLLLAAALTVCWHLAIQHLGSITSALGANVSAFDQRRLQGIATTQLPFFAFSFAAGMTAAWGYIRLSQQRADGPTRRAVIAAQVLSAVSLCAFAYVIGRRAAGPGPFPGSPEGARLSPVLALGYSGSLAALMLATAMPKAIGGRLFAHPAARALGDMSYGIYLIHMVLVICALAALGFSADGSPGALLALAAAVLPLSLAYGYLSARLVETPVRRWARQFGRRDKPRAVSVPRENASTV